MRSQPVVRALRVCPDFLSVGSTPAQRSRCGVPVARHNQEMLLIWEHLHISSFWRKSWWLFPGSLRYNQQLFWDQQFPGLAEQLPVSQQWAPMPSCGSETQASPLLDTSMHLCSYLGNPCYFRKHSVLLSPAYDFTLPPSFYFSTSYVESS